MATAVINRPQFRLSRKARLVRTAVLLAIVITGVNQFGQFSGAQATNQSTTNIGSVHYVSVRSGDTLWSMAERLAPNTDPRDWIDRVTVMNNLGTSGVWAGQRIAVPSN
jgi:predicted Zn-dependent protease